MKNSPRNPILLLIALAAILTSTLATADVTIPDPGLEGAIRSNLVLGPTDPITETALAGLTHFYANARGIVDLTGLEYCTSLTVLHLEDNKISDLTGLQGLTSLTTLYLHNNQISDLTPLSGLTSLTELWLYENQISDLTPLSGLTSVEVLILSESCISDLSPLLSLPALSSLSINHNPLSDTAQNVQIPQLVGNGVGVDFITWSDDYCAAAVSIPDPGLNSAIRANLGLGPTDPLTKAALAGIMYLNAEEYNIADLTGLEYCVGLESLNLFNNQCSDLTPLSGLPHLESLRLELNQINDLAPLQGLTDLRILHLNHNQISDLAPLSGLTSLTVLYLGENQISDLTPLSGLTSLDSVGLYVNCISDLTPLLGLPAGGYLGINLNPLSDTAITVQIPLLEENGVDVVFTTYSDENCTASEGEGEPPAEGEGEPLVEGEGEPPVEGEGEVIENPEGCPKPYGGTYEAGDDLCLCVPWPVSSTSTYAWAKDGVPLTDSGRIYGANARTLHIILLTIEDSGLYTCTYDDSAKAIQVFEAPVRVVDELPALNTLGLIALAASGSMLGFLIQKKRA